MASTLITPQAHLIDSLASRSIYLIEKAEKKAKKKPTANASAPRKLSVSAKKVEATATAPANKRTSINMNATLNEKNLSKISADEGSAQSTEIKPKRKSILPEKAEPKEESPSSDNEKEDKSEDKPAADNFKTMITYDDEEDPADYLKAMNEVRKSIKN